MQSKQHNNKNNDKTRTRIKEAADGLGVSKAGGVGQC
jgi:hypothetical protein